MLVIDVDVINPQPLERAVAGLAHVLRPAVYAPSPLTVRAAHESELRGHPHFVTPAADRLADQLLVGERAVGVRRVEQINPQIQGPVDGRDGLGLVCRPVGIAHTHAAEPHRGDDQTLLAESFLLHGLSPHALSGAISQRNVTLGGAVCPSSHPDQLSRNITFFSITSRPMRSLLAGKSGSG